MLILATRAIAPLVCFSLLAAATASFAQNTSDDEVPAPDVAASAGAVDAETAAVPPPDTQPLAPADDSDDGLTGGQALLAKLQEGGRTMLALLALSVVALSVAVERLVHLRRKAFLPDAIVPEVRNLWTDGNFTALQDLCRDNPSVFSRIVSYLAKHRTDSAELLTREAEELGQQEMWIHLQRTRPLAVVATLSPLLGLFGTVLGMIESFDTVALMGELGDASLLAGGISKALITTAGGLLLAIPALGLYHYFRGRTELYGHLIETELSELIREQIRRNDAGGVST